MVAVDFVVRNREATEVDEVDLLVLSPLIFVSDTTAYINHVPKLPTRFVPVHR